MWLREHGAQPCDAVIVAASDLCPNCGEQFDDEFLVSGSHWCPTCGTLFTEVGDTLYDVKELRGPDGECESCGASLSGGTAYLPYEDGSNAEAYVACSSCGHHNVRAGFGGA